MFKELLVTALLTPNLVSFAYADEGKHTDTTPLVSPIFGQLVAISLPKTFKPVFEKIQGPNYLQRLVLEGETTEKWTEMISLGASKGLASDPTFSPHNKVSQITGIFMGTCPNTFSYVDFGVANLNGIDAFVTVVSCGIASRPGELPYSMAAITAAFKGKYDIYTIQWAQRGIASNIPIKLDADTWMNKLKTLSPVKLCPIISGEVAPYQSCINQK